MLLAGSTRYLSIERRDTESRLADPRARSLFPTVKPQPWGLSQLTPFLVRLGLQTQPQVENISPRMETVTRSGTIQAQECTPRTAARNLWHCPSDWNRRLPSGRPDTSCAGYPHIEGISTVRGNNSEKKKISKNICFWSLLTGHKTISDYVLKLRSNLKVKVNYGLFILCISSQLMEILKFCFWEPIKRWLKVKSSHAISFEGATLKLEWNIAHFGYLLWSSRMSFSVYTRRQV